MQKWRSVVFQWRALIALGVIASLFAIILVLRLPVALSAIVILIPFLTVIIWKLPEKQVDRFHSIPPFKHGQFHTTSLITRPYPTESPQIAQSKDHAQVVIASIEDAKLELEIVKLASEHRKMLAQIITRVVILGSLLFI